MPLGTQHKTRPRPRLTRIFCCGHGGAPGGIRFASQTQGLHRPGRTGPREPAYTGSMARFLIIGGFLAAVFWVFSIVDCAIQPATRHRGVSKGAWMAIVILLPVLGGILWFVIGRTRKSDDLMPLMYAPDDDPEFLHRISQAEADARIARLEAELARLEDESDDRPDPRT